MAVKLRVRDDTWFYRVEVDGVRYQKYGFQSKREAKSAEWKLLNDLEAGKKPLSAAWRSLTFDEACRVFYAEHAQNLGHSKDYRCRLPVIAASFSGKKLAEITRDDIRRMREFVREKEGVSELTVNHYHAHVKALFNWWIKEKELPITNPAEGVKMAQVAKARVRFLYPAEEKALDAYLKEKEPALWPYYHLALETGLREANVCGLRCDEVDFTLGQIFVPGDRAKNGESGYIPIKDSLRPFLMSSIGIKTGASPVLSSYSANTIANKFSTVAEAAGVPNFTFHCLRHTFAYKLLSRGESLYHVSKLLLHKDTRVTEAHYGHLAVSDLAAVVNRGSNGERSWVCGESHRPVGATIQTPVEEVGK